MKIAVPRSLEEARPLVEHLAAWGEVCAVELAEIEGGASWLEELQSCGVLGPIASADAWAVTASGERLLALADTSSDQLLRAVFFAHPGYRRYLLGIITEGVASAARAGLLERVEMWSGGELLSVLDGMNALADELERTGQRLVDRTASEFAATFRSLPERSAGFAGWDQCLLGQSGLSDRLFQHALTKFAPAATTGGDTCVDTPPCVLRELPLNPDDGLHLVQVIRPAAWNRRRYRVQGGIPLYSVSGELEGEPTAVSTVGLRRAIQDALVESPFYAAVIHLIVASRRAEYGDGSRVTVAMRLCDVASAEVRVAGKWATPLAVVLPELVSQMGVRPILPNGRDASQCVSNILRNLLAQEVMVVEDDALRLHPDFSRSLVSGTRRKRITHEGRDIQARLLGLLDRLAGGSP